METTRTLDRQGLLLPSPGTDLRSTKRPTATGKRDRVLRESEQESSGVFFDVPVGAPLPCLPSQGTGAVPVPSHGVLLPGAR